MGTETARMFGWIQARWNQERARREHWKEFQALGLQDVRRRAENSIYDPEKLKHAWGWIHNRETRYQRRAFIVSIIAVIISLSALAVSKYSADNARKADRAWLGPASVRLNERPVGGKRLEFVVEYQNTGRQPALSVAYFLGSHALPESDKRGANRDRALEDVKSCKLLMPEDQQVIFPGKGNLEPYRPVSDLLQTAVDAQVPIYVDGCFAYWTVDGPHHTAFCFKYDPDFPRHDAEGKLMLDLCDFGHYAD